MTTVTNEKQGKKKVYQKPEFVQQEAIERFSLTACLQKVSPACPASALGGKFLD